MHLLLNIESTAPESIVLLTHVFDEYENKILILHQIYFDNKKYLYLYVFLYVEAHY